MEKRNIKVIRLLMLIALPTIFLITNCAEIQLSTITPPSADAKLRIFIQPTSSIKKNMDGGRHTRSTKKKCIKQYGKSLQIRECMR